ncbi:MAG: hypothetical protein BWY76_01460 [bacterium ADurb.Bin429]|nr:MAG: hypothetical protein BWY76_01460 [bacterium ADurb.Bin429]
MSGPYYLTATPVVELSEVVTVNDLPKERGREYTLDYQNGILNFTSTSIISPADRVTVSYEVSVNGSGGGRLTAVRGFYPITDALSVGATHIQLNGRGSAAGSTQRDERDQFLGTGTPGPFYLTYRPIVAQSETVTINGVLQARGTAYTLDNTTGRLLFTNGKEPPPGSTVVVRYAVTQVTAASSGDRSVTGVDVNWAQRGLQLGLQAAKSTGGGIQNIGAEQVKDEQFTVQAGIPVTQQVFRLRKTPVQPNSDSVRALALPLIRGTEYSLNYQTGELRILRADIPISNLGPTLFVSYSTEARSVALQGDSALALTANYGSEKVAANAAYRRVDPGFSPIERAGYRNVREGLEWGASYMPTSELTFSTSGDNTTLPYNPYSSVDNILMEEKNRTYGVEYRREDWPALSLRRTTRDSTQIGTEGLGDTSVTDSLSITWDKSPLTASLNLNQREIDTRQLRYSTDPYQPLPDTPQTTDPIYHYRATTSDASLNLNYTPNDRLNIGANLATNRIKADTDGVATTSSGRNAQVSANYRVTDRLTLNSNLTTTKTDATRTASGSDVPAQTSTDLSVGADWQARENLSVGLNYSTNSARGGEYSNSDSTMLAANIWWQPASRVSLNGYWNRQDLNYTDILGSSVNNMLGASAQVSLGKATINLDAQRIWGENSFGVAQMFQSEAQAQRQVVLAQVAEDTAATTTGNKLTTLAAKVTYPVADKHEIFVAGETLRNSGFPSGSRKQTLGLGWNYHLTDQLTLTLNAQQLNYKDDVNNNLDYNARHLNAQLSWNF